MTGQYVYRNGWIAYLDIFGFGEAVSGGEKQLYDRLSACLESIEAFARQNKLEFASFSDSILIYYFEDAGDLISRFTSFYEQLRDIIDLLTNAGFLPRGSVASGKILAAPRAIVGAPVVRAVRVEQLLAVPCVVLPHLECEARRVPHLFSTLMPTKDGGVLYAMPLMGRTLSTQEDLAQRLFARTKVAGPARTAAALSNLISLIGEFREFDKEVADKFAGRTPGRNRRSRKAER